MSVASTQGSQRIEPYVWRIRSVVLVEGAAP